MVRPIIELDAITCIKNQVYVTPAKAGVQEKGCNIRRVRTGFRLSPEWRA